jgi:hypothetical protein
MQKLNDQQPNKKLIGEFNDEVFLFIKVYDELSTLCKVSISYFGLLRIDHMCFLLF